MADITLYHNPRCSKSRQTLALIEAQGVQADIVLYLENPPTPQALNTLLNKLDKNPEDIVRKGEDIYKSLDLKNKDLSREEWLELMTSNPKLIERPIAVKGDKAVLGRPPENVLELFN